MSDKGSPSQECKIVFKKRKNRSNIRSTQPSADIAFSEEVQATVPQGDDDSVDWSTLDDFRELKRSKKRLHNGINVLDLMSDNNKKKEEHKSEKREGGLKDLKTLASELDLGNTFSLETNRRDEDAELMKYVEEELAKRRPKIASETGDAKSSAAKSNLTDDLLVRVIPEHLLKATGDSSKMKEDMLSSQMLSGIPEVDLGIEERIRNIEATEAARTKLLEERLRQEKPDRKREGDGDTGQVPSNFVGIPNLASCYKRNSNIVQQAANASSHRFSLNAVPSENKDLIEHFIRKEEKGNQTHKQPPKQTYEIEPVVVLGAEPQKVRMPKPMDKERRMPGKDKPTDDYIFEKFRKQLKKR